MARYFCHEHPEVLTLEARVIDARPGAVVLERTPFHPGGGGQLADRGRLRWAGGDVGLARIESDGERVWHVLAEPVEIVGMVEAAVDPAFRGLMAQLHTNAHVVSALVFQRFHGALITGAQLNEDGPGRMYLPPAPQRSPARKRGCPRNQRAAVLAPKAYSPSVQRPSPMNRSPSSSTCTPTWPRSTSTNCGRKARKNSAVLGLNRLTTNPSRTARPSRGAPARATGDDAERSSRRRTPR